MTHAKKMLQIVLMIAGSFVVLATSDPQEETLGESDIWIITNLFDGETAVPVEQEVVLAIGYLDFEETAGARSRRAIDSIKLYAEDDPEDTVELDPKIGETETILRHDGLKTETRYVLDVTGIEAYLGSERDVPEPITFSTMSTPMVHGIYRNDDTLFITFSEPMDPDSLFLGHDSVDIYWQEGDELYSIVYDLNLADFSYDATEWMFRIAPVGFLDEVWVKVSGQVRGLSDVHLDGNQNRIPEEDGDDHIQAVTIDELETCFTREDIPQPCITEDEVPQTLINET